MKYVLLLISIVLLSAKAHAVDYYNAKVTGVGIVAGENRIRFTIDKDPNVVFLSDQFAGDQLNKLTTIILAAYTAQSNIYMIRSSEATSSTTRHYTDVVIVSVGSYVFN